MNEIKILIIDDNEDDFLVMKRFLERLGYNKFFFSNTGEAGIEKAKQEKPELVITDTLLPESDGFLVCRTIKEFFGAAVKIIIITGNIDAVDAIKARKAGADDYTVKTRDYEGLITAVTNLMRE